LAYERRTSDGRQKVHLDLLVRPRYARDSFHLSLRAAICFPEMAKIAMAMLGPRAGGYGKGGIVHVAVLDMITPNPPMILFRAPGDLAAEATDIERYFALIVAYLDERDTIERLTGAMWRGWLESVTRAKPEFPEAAQFAGPWPAMIAAGQVALGDRRAALQTLERCYPQGSAERAEYQHAFVWLGLPE
jgi:hypothetical protein